MPSLMIRVIARQPQRTKLPKPRMSDEAHPVFELGAPGQQSVPLSFLWKQPSDPGPTSSAKEGLFFLGGRASLHSRGWRVLRKSSLCDSPPSNSLAQDQPGHIRLDSHKNYK